MPDLSDGYHATRQRITELAAGLSPEELALPVPACPGWSIHDLIVHVGDAAGDDDAELFTDIVGHEQDLLAALGRRRGRGRAEVRAAVPLLLDLLAPAVRAADLGALVVDCGPVRWATHFARPGCTLRIEPWEALRVLQSRRTAEEVRALPGSGDVEPYLAVLDARSPLPTTSLQER